MSATARLDLEQTSIRMPFADRIASMDVETTQFVGAGTVMASAGDISAAEIVAQVPQDQFARFVALAYPLDLRAGFDKGTELDPAPSGLGWTGVQADVISLIFTAPGIGPAGRVIDLRLSAPISTRSRRPASNSHTGLKVTGVSST